MRWRAGRRMPKLFPHDLRANSFRVGREGKALHTRRVKPEGMVFRIKR
jgi:hypothetical protein